MRYASIGKRDANEAPIFEALQKAGCFPVRGTDVDIFCRRKPDRVGVMIEVKIPGKKRRLTQLQKDLREIFQDRYHVVESVEDALKAVGS